MPESHDANERTPSTNWEWGLRKIRSAPPAESRAERSESSLGSLLAWPRRKPLSITVKWRGGPEAWWEIRARGRTIRRPGHLALHDVLCEITRWESQTYK